MASRTQDVTKSRQKAQEAGRRRLSAMLSPKATALYEELRAARGGSESALIEAALAALANKGKDLTQDQVIDWIRRNT